jgi:Tol biopolymer transport system component
MTAFEPYGTLPAELPDLLTELAAPRLPDYTDDVLAITAGTRQRPRWAHLERWLPMIITRQRLVTPALPWRPLLAVLVTLALIGGLLFVASQQKRLPPPFGPAANGLVAYERDGNLYVRDTIDGPERPLITDATTEFAVGFLRGGTKVNYLRAAPGGGEGDPLDMVVANLDGSNPTVIASGLLAPNWGDMSPDDSLFVFHAVDPSTPKGLIDDWRAKLFVADLVHPATPRILSLPGIESATVPDFRGPDGADIIFRGRQIRGGGSVMGVFAVHPDGSGLRPLTPVDGNPDYTYQQPLPSPDGRYVTYTSFNSLASQLQIHILDLTTGEDRMITEKGGPSEGFATFSPDGTRIVFVRYYDNTDEIWIRPIEPGAKAIPAGPAYPMVEGQYIGSSFSPDGKYVIVNDPASKETRLVDAVEGGYGQVIPWATAGFSWQRVAR